MALQRTSHLVHLGKSPKLFCSSVALSLLLGATAEAQTIVTLAGTGTGGYNNSAGVATATQLATPGGLGLDAAGNLYIADTGNCRIRRVDVTGNLTTVAGTATCTYNGDNVLATGAAVKYPQGVSVDASENIYIADAYNGRIRRIDHTTGYISTFAGGGGKGQNRLRQLMGCETTLVHEDCLSCTSPSTSCPI